MIMLATYEGLPQASSCRERFPNLDTEEDLCEQRDEQRTAPRSIHTEVLVLFRI